jgi:tetratricopeptide (TPR) repeat protein
MYVIVFLMGVLPVVSTRASVGADLSQAEGQYKAGQYTQAEQSYLKVINEADPNKPAEAEAAFTARKMLPLVYIATDRLPQAKDAVQQLLSRYAQYEYLPHAIHEIVEGSEPLLKVAQVRQLYQDMVTAQPADPQAIWLKMGVAIASVHLAEDKAVDAVLQNITTQHGSDARASEALNHIAWAYRKLQRYSEALTIYQYVVNNWPQKDRVVFAQQSIAICQLRLGDRQAADAALEVMLQKFGKDKNTSKLLAWAVFEYLQAGETEGAYKVFDLVLQTYPEAPETIGALLSLATGVIQGDDRARIEPTVQTLLTRFVPTEAKASALHTVADMLGWKCRDYGNYPLEEQNLPGICNRCLLAIANYTLATWPKSDWAMWAQRDLATAAMHRGDNPSAEAAISRLSTDYADRKDTPAALNFLADYCLALKKDNAAETVYQHVAKEYPTYDLILLTKVGLGVIQIRQGDDQGAEATFQKVLTDYANHPRLAEAVNLMAEEYSKRAFQDPPWLPSGGPYLSEEAKTYLRKAAEKWDLIVTTLAVHPSITPSAHYDLATTYYYLGECPKVEAHCSQLRAGWPADEHAWMTYVLIVKTYQDSLWKGEIRQKDCDAKTKLIYDELVSRYPNCPAAPMVRDWLNRNGRSIEGENK